MERVRGAVLVVLIGSLTGCGGDGLDLVVELKTDLAPGYEFDAVRTELLDELPGAGTAVGSSVVETTAVAGEAYSTGQRIAELSGLSPGDRIVRVQVHHAGTFVAERIVQLELRSSFALTVLLTRDCAGVECPGADDDPTAIACLGGRCVQPDCAGEGCVTECAVDRDCPRLAMCADPRCESGACFYVAMDARCAAAERCSVEAGCVGSVSDGGPADGGPGDGGMSDAGPPDAGADAGPMCTCTPGETRGGGCDSCSVDTCQPDCRSFSCELRTGNECDYRDGATFRRCKTASGATGSEFCLMSCDWSGACCVLGGGGCNVTADCCVGVCSGGVCN